jgi:sulfonate transport system substrate-binding protein
VPAGPAETFADLRISSDTASIEFTPALIAAEDYYPGKATVSSGGIAAMLMDSKQDLGTNAETQALRQSLDHPNLRIIFTVTETFYRIIASKKAGIAKLADLKGKRIGTIANTSAAFYTEKMLGTVGVKASEVTISSGGTCLTTPCGANSLPGLLSGGKVDAVTLWEPTCQLAADAIGDDAIIFQDKSVYREIVNLHTTSEKLADPVKRRAIVAFVRSLAKAQELYRTSPEKVWPRIAKAIGMQQPVLEKVWEDERFQGTLTPDLLDVLVEEDVWVAKEKNRTPRTREQLATLIDDSIAKEALATP